MQSGLKLNTYLPSAGVVNQSTVAASVSGVVADAKIESKPEIHVDLKKLFTKKMHRFVMFNNAFPYFVGIDNDGFALFDPENVNKPEIFFKHPTKGLHDFKFILIDSIRFASCSLDQNGLIVNFWSIESGELIATYQKKHFLSCHFTRFLLAISPDSRVIGILPYNNKKSVTSHLSLFVIDLQSTAGIIGEWEDRRFQFCQVLPFLKFLSSNKVVLPYKQGINVFTLNLNQSTWLVDDEKYFNIDRMIVVMDSHDDDRWVSVSLGEKNQVTIALLNINNQNGFSVIRSTVMPNEKNIQFLQYCVSLKGWLPSGNLCYQIIDDVYILDVQKQLFRKWGELPSPSRGVELLSDGRMIYYFFGGEQRGVTEITEPLESYDGKVRDAVGSVLSVKTLATLVMQYASYSPLLFKALKNKAELTQAVNKKGIAVTASM